MKILNVTLSVISLLLCSSLFATNVKLPEKILPFECIDKKYSNISLKDYIYLDMYFPSKKYFQHEILKHKVNQQDFSLSIEKIINYRDSMIYGRDWKSILENFDFSRDYKNMSAQFIKALRHGYEIVTRYIEVSLPDARMLSLIKSTGTSWDSGIELLRQTYSPEGNPRSLEDAVALVFLHIYPPKPYSPPMFDSLRSKLSQSYRSASEAARSEHYRKEKEDFIFFMNCMAHAIGLIEQKDPLELFGYDEVTDGATSFSISIPRTSSAESVESAGSSSSASSSESSTSSSSITCSEKSSSTSTSSSDPADTGDIVRRRK